MPAKPACSHRRWCIVASTTRGSDQVHWCPNCGATRPKEDGRRGPWLVPGPALVRDILKEQREQRKAESKKKTSKSNGADELVDFSQDMR